MDIYERKVHIHRKLTYTVNGRWKMRGSEEFITWKFTLLSNLPHVKRFEMEKCKTSYILASKCYSVSLYFHWKEKCRNSERMHVQLTWLWPFGKLFFLTIVFSLMVERYLKSTTYLNIQGKWTKIHLHYFLWYKFINAIT